MPKIFTAGALALASVACCAADLTETETRWLQGAMPVIAHAQQLKLPLDIVVQPQPSAGLAPLALAFIEGRCKLVLSMRGNPEAEATLERMEPALRGPVLELMAAHEIGHCRRYLDGAWMNTPAGFVTSSVPTSLKPDQRQAWMDMKATRREEGYGDLVGLSWTQQHHPELYGQVRNWLLKERSRDLIPGSHHDTLAWVRLAVDGRAFDGPTLFDGVTALWKAGLAAD
ncbi:hypothetical protein [Ideonella sp. YS5]|uniref:hypothetical protein n=1 Tax=Ideonella sp. YS5 TaxID=3453714 RepID=UPI003EEDE2ED